MDKSLEPEKKRALIKIAILILITVSFYSFIFFKSDFFSTCTGTQVWVVGTILIWVLIYLLMGKRRKPPAIYLFYALFLLSMYVVVGAGTLSWLLSKDLLNNTLK